MEKEYKDLKEELKSIGYKLKARKKLTAYRWRQKKYIEDKLNEPTESDERGHPTGSY